jgi:Na+/H+-dicarboxylate symporter
MSLTTRILIALAAGLLLGAGLAHFDLAPEWLVGTSQLVGTLWLNALRMTIVPLVFAMLVTAAVSAAATAAAGGVAARALVAFVVLLVTGALFATAATHVLLELSPVLPDGIAAIRTGLGVASEPLPDVPPLADWLQGLVPANPLRAAVDDAMVPLVLFALLFGFAAARLGGESRDHLVGFFQALGDVMLTLVRWVLLVGPVGVFALSLVLGLRTGLGAAGALVHYVLVVSATCLLITLALYALVPLAGIRLRSFAHAAGAGQVVGFSTQSSLAALPAMIDGARRHLGVPSSVTGFVLPLAVAMFRYTSPAANIAVAMYLAACYGLEPSLVEVGVTVLVATVVSFGAVSLPGQVSFLTSCIPICMALGVPVEALPLLLAVESVPDIFRTVGNVTADVAVTAYVGRERSG